MGRIRTIAGLQRTLDANNRRMAVLYRRPYILEKAVATYAARFEQLVEIQDDAARFSAFRALPALEADLDAIDKDLTPKSRLSLAQQDRAKHHRAILTESGERIEDIIFAVLEEDPAFAQKKAQQFFIPVFNRLEKLGLQPLRVTDPDKPGRERIEYQFGQVRRSLSQGQLANYISRWRASRRKSLN